MSLVDELKAALPGWTVTGDDSGASAVLGEVSIACRRYGHEDRVSLEIDGREVRVIYANKLKNAVGLMRIGLKTDVAKWEMRIKDAQAALNALGGTK